MVVPVAVFIGCASAPARRERPWVFISPGQDVQTCAVVHPRGSIRDFEPPHAHLVFFLSPRGEIVHGDTLLVEVVTANNPAARVTFALSEGDILTFGYPGGLGAHEVVATWRDAQGRVKARSEQRQSVWDCGRRDEWTTTAPDP